MLTSISSSLFRNAPSRVSPLLGLWLSWLALPALVWAGSSASSETLPPRLSQQILAAEAGMHGSGGESWLAGLAPGGVGTFDDQGLRLAGQEADELWQLGLRLRAMGRQGAMSPLSGGRLTSQRHRAELDFGGIRQWVSPARGGLSQSFLVTRPPWVNAADGRAEGGSGDLLFDLELSGDFAPSLNQDGRAVALRHGEQTWALGGLAAEDAQGRALPASLELIEGGLRLRLEDDGQAPFPLLLTVNLTQVKKLINPTAQLLENAGWAVDIDGDTAVVGARFADVPFIFDAGVAYIFERNLGGAENWGLVKAISATEPWGFANFGVSVAISGDLIAIGANNHDEFLIPHAGRAYLFERNAGGLDNWGEIKRFDNPEPLIDDYFGWDVALDGDTLAVAGFGDDLPFIANAGRVFVYQKDVGGFDNWGMVKALESESPQPFGHFGSSLALDGDSLVVGANLEDVEAIDDGAVYVFERNEGGPDFWGASAVLKATDGKGGDRFGDDVAIDGDTLVVGADFADNMSLDVGSAYVFERNLGGAGFWGQAAKLTASDGSAFDFFGWAVAIQGDVIVVGAHLDDSPVFDAGSAYLYRRDAGGVGAWGEVEQFTADLTAASDDFGLSIALDGSTVLVGAGADDQAAAGAGAAYIFELADQADLAISVASTPNPVAAGGTVTYTVSVTNLSSVDAQDVVVAHAFGPDGTGSTTSGCGEDPNGVASCSLGIVAAGATVQYTVSRPVSGSASGSLSLTASLSSSTVDPSPGNDTFTDVVIVGGGGGGSADLLLLLQDSADPVDPGSSLTYTLVVLNNGPGLALDVQVTEMLPTGVSGAVTSGCTEDPAGTPSCSLGNVLPGTSTSFTVEVNVDSAAGETLLNQAIVSASTDDPNGTNNAASETTAVGAGSADLSIFMEEDVDPIQAGDSMTYTIQVLNNGPDAAQDVVTTVVLPTGATALSTTGCDEDPAGAASCTLGEIAAGTSAQYTLTVQTDAGELGTLTASAEVSSSALDGNLGNNSTTEATTAEAAGDVDLYVFQTDSVDPVEPGNELVYTVIVGNRGPSTAQAVELTDIIPADLSGASTSGCDEDPAGVPFCSLGSIAPSTLKVVTITVEVPSSIFSGTLTNEASVESANPELDAADNSATETTTIEGLPGMTDLFLSIEEQVDPVPAGGQVVYEITVLNLGPFQAPDATVMSLLPAGLSNPTTAGCSEDPAGLDSCSLGIVDVGVPRVITVTADIDPTTSGLLTFEATVSSTIEDSAPGNNSNTETTEIEAIALSDLAVSFSQSDGTAAPGGVASYTVVVENLGPDPAEDVVVASSVTGDVGTAMTTGCAEDPSGFDSCALGTVNRGIGSLEVFSSVSFTIELPILANASGLIELTSAVSSAMEDPETANNSRSFLAEIDSVPPTVTKVSSLADTGDGMIDPCEQTSAEINHLLVTFSEPMDDPAGDSEISDVTNPAVYRLVSAGPDHDVQTDQCSMLEGDDELLVVDSVAWDVGTLTASLDMAQVLPNAPYRLLVCEAVSDAAGNGLDGNDDGMAGVDFGRYFRVDQGNLFSEGHFDCNLEEWERVSTADSEVDHTAFDVDSAFISGATVIYNGVSTTEFSLGQCVAVERRGTHIFTGMAWLRDLEAEVTVNKTCEFFPEAECRGTALATASDGETFQTPTATWQALSPSSLDAPNGTLSALCSVDLLLADEAAEMTVLIDDLRLTSEVLFEDGFESGDVSEWSLAVNE